jgi:GDP-L-fucose synthase
MICIGSGAEYGMEHYLPMMKEDYFGVHMPKDIYGFSKYVIAKDIESRHRNIYNLRVFGIYGKYENYKRRFISNNICRALCGLNLSMRKNMRFDYLYIDDFIRIVEIFMERFPEKRSYNVCTGKPVDLFSLARIIQRVDGKNLPIDIREDGLSQEYSGDNSLFLGEFGKFDFTGHEEGVRQLYDWYKNSSGLSLRTEDFS